MSRYVLGIDQSTQGTKALLFDEEGTLISRTDLPHKQYINEKGWVEHNPEEIYANTLAVVKNLVEKAGINKNDLAVLGISNQRETAMVWNRTTGKPVYNAVVWQCARGAQICEEIESRRCGHDPFSYRFTVISILLSGQDCLGTEECRRGTGTGG